MTADWEEGNFMPQASRKAVSIHQRIQVPFDLVIETPDWKKHKLESRLWEKYQ